AAIRIRQPDAPVRIARQPHNRLQPIRRYADAVVANRDLRRLPDLPNADADPASLLAAHNAVPKRVLDERLYRQRGNRDRHPLIHVPFDREPLFEALLLNIEVGLYEPQLMIQRYDLLQIAVRIARPQVIAERRQQ